jgi:hypothetical protein
MEKTPKDAVIFPEINVKRILIRGKYMTIWARIFGIGRYGTGD